MKGGLKRTVAALIGASMLLSLTAGNAVIYAGETEAELQAVELD